MFLLASAILFTGKVLPRWGVSASRRCVLRGRLGQTPLDLPTGEGVHPGGIRQTPSEIHGILRDTVNKWAVGILLECFLAENVKRLNSEGAIVLIHCMGMSFITARKRSLGQGNIFTPVCHSVHSGGHAWLLWGGWGGMHGCSGGDLCGCCGGHVWLLRGEGHAWLLLGGHAWLLRGEGHAWLLLGGHAWLLWGEGHVWLLWGASVVALGGVHGCSRGGHAWLLQGGVHGIRRHTEIQSMSGRYASYWNAFLFVSVNY